MYDGRLEYLGFLAPNQDLSNEAPALVDHWRQCGVVVPDAVLKAQLIFEARRAIRELIELEGRVAGENHQTDE